MPPKDFDYVRNMTGNCTRAAGSHLALIEGIIRGLIEAEMMPDIFSI